MNTRAHVILFAITLAPGCSAGGFDPVTYLGGLRVLGVIADPPEVAPGARSHMTALALDTDTDGTPVMIEWAACTDSPGPVEDVSPRCLTEAQAPFLTPLGTGPSADVTMPDIDPTRLGRPDFTDGFYLPIRLRATAGTATLASIYRLRYVKK